MGPSYWPRLMFLEQTGPHGRQLRRPFWPTFHWERAPRMCLELTGSLWRFQKWCEKVESDQKWPSYRDLKITHFHKSRVAVERWWPKQGSDDDPRTLLPPLPLGFVKVGNFQISVILKAYLGALPDHWWPGTFTLILYGWWKSKTPDCLQLWGVTNISLSVEYVSKLKVAFVSKDRVLCKPATLILTLYISLQKRKTFQNVFKLLLLIFQALHFSPQKWAALNIQCRHRV